MDELKAVTAAVQAADTTNLTEVITSLWCGMPSCSHDEAPASRDPYRVYLPQL